MPVAVALVDPLPSFRQGLASALVEEGFRVAYPKDLHRWICPGGPGRRAILITTESRVETDTIAQLRRLSSGVAIVALLTTPAIDLYRDVLAAGACAAIVRSAPPREIIEVLIGSLRRISVLPVDVVYGLATSSVESDAASCLLPHHVAWLRSIAAGKSIDSVAASVGYSRRQMLREFRLLYTRMGVDGQRQALIQAARWGLFDESNRSPGR